MLTALGSHSTQKALEDRRTAGTAAPLPRTLFNVDFARVRMTIARMDARTFASPAEVVGRDRETAELKTALARTLSHLVR